MKILKSEHPNVRKYGYVALLFCVLLILALFPFLNQSLFSIAFFNTLFSLILIAGLYAVSTTRTRFYIGLAIFIPTIILKWMTYSATDLVSATAYHLVSLFFFCFILYVLCHAVFTSKKIDLNIIFGATCVYIILGVIWAFLYALIDLYQPIAFSGIADTPAIVGTLDHLTYRFENLLYFSFVTLTTLGFGDIAPYAPGPRFLSIIEAITGQLYIATSIARVIGLYISQSKEAKD